VDLAELKELLWLLAERDITEFELEEEGMKLRVRKAAAAAPAAGAPTLPAVPTASAAPAAATSAPPADVMPVPASPPAEEPGLVVMKSPMVGTFYRASEPNAAPFVSVGDRVRVGQVLCIIEAMKLMNELEAEVAGEIVKVHADNGQPVQFGEPLFTIRPEK
jgi:acetyl-CoA carboxylase biotin carboxyl carrier protein